MKEARKSGSLQTDEAALVTELRELIDHARTRAAAAVNAELTPLYWQIGQRLRSHVLKGERGAYGEQVVRTVAVKLTSQYGRGWGEKQLRNCLRVAETFPEEQTLSALRGQLSWTHIKTLMYLDDPTKRDFYIELCRLENWSSRQLQERVASMVGDFQKAGNDHPTRYCDAEADATPLR